MRKLQPQIIILKNVFVLHRGQHLFFKLYIKCNYNVGFGTYFYLRYWSTSTYVSYFESALGTQANTYLLLLNLWYYKPKGISFKRKNVLLGFLYITLPIPLLKPPIPLDFRSSCRKLKLLLSNEYFEV